MVFLIAAKSKSRSRSGGEHGKAGLSLRVNVGIVGILFHQDILSSPALLILYRENAPRTKIIQISQSSPINHAGKFPVHFIGDNTLLPRVAHCLNLPDKKSPSARSRSSV